LNKYKQVNSFTISQISRFSGVKAHTIRIWEQRYNSLNPKRSEGNTRYYSGAQLRRLLNIVSLVEKGHKVSELSAMPDEKIFKVVKEYTLLQSDTSREYYILQLIAAAVNYDEVHFDKIFSHCLLKFGMKNTYITIFHPLLVRLGMLWSCDNLPPAQEHFISNLIVQKLYTAIDSLPPAQSQKDSWLLFMPENDYHEIGLLFAQFLIRVSGKKVISLGPNLPFDSVVEGVKEIKPKNILLFLINSDLPEITASYLKRLQKNIRESKIFVAGNEELLEKAMPLKGISWLRSVQLLQEQLNGN
jgi:DNA-binding transcriptional MerR regulator